ncbi:MAG TPA: nitronate monooxygenase [Solirubrobacterales bacterium]|nr:nitronate monooxygenase [Solirubrobacterales bacterium]
MGAFLEERLGVELPIVQAGMGGGLDGHELAAAVSAAGGLGTIGILDPAHLREEMAAARRLSDGPLAVNLLLPFARRAHFEAASEADVLVTFWGRPERRTPGVWIHQCGSVEEAAAARVAGADAVIAQGVEAGGHVRGTTAAMELLARVRAALPDDYPVLAAGGIADRADVEARLDAGAAAVVCGTRFLLTTESGGHSAYKDRLLGARETVLTELFGVGWPAPHRVVPNAATARWLRKDPRGPGLVRALHKATAPLVSRLPDRVHIRLATAQDPGRPLFGPVAATADAPPNLIEAGPLYAGECVARIDDVRPAGELVRELAGRAPTG